MGPRQLNEFFVPPDSFRDLFSSAGLQITTWNDKTDLAKKAFEQLNEPVGEVELPIMGVYMLVGKDIRTKACNLSASDRRNAGLSDLL